jgi:hypothetical protein
MAYEQREFPPENDECIMPLSRQDLIENDNDETPAGK